MFRQARISHRLSCIQQVLDPRQELWDLCCDHGLVGQNFLYHSDVQKVFFIDSVKHICQSLSAHLSEDGYHIEVICHDLRKALKRPMKGNIVIAGVGGDLVLKILETQEIAKGSNLVLNPFKDIDLVRNLDLELISHQSFDERGRTREIFQFRY